MTTPEPKPMQAAFLPIISGMIAHTWIYIITVAVVVFGTGGGETWLNV